MKVLYIAVIAAAFSSGCTGRNSSFRVTTPEGIGVVFPFDSCSALTVDEDIMAIQAEHEGLPLFALVRRWDDRRGLEYMVRVCTGDRCYERTGFIPDTAQYRAEFRVDDGESVSFTPPVSALFAAWSDLVDECRRE